jgi:hypothetical protein
MVALPAAQAAPRWVYAISRLDTAGRVSDLSTVRALGWAPDERVQLAAYANQALIARRDAQGLVAVTRRGYLRIPAALRARCAMRSGEQVLLAASPDADVLVVHTLSSVEHLLRTQHETCLEVMWP